MARVAARLARLRDRVFGPEWVLGPGILAPIQVSAGSGDSPQSVFASHQTQRASNSSSAAHARRSSMAGRSLDHRRARKRAPAWAQRPPSRRWRL